MKLNVHNRKGEAEACAKKPGILSWIASLCAIVSCLIQAVLFGFHSQKAALFVLFASACLSDYKWIWWTKETPLREASECLHVCVRWRRPQRLTSPLNRLFDALNPWNEQTCGPHKNYASVHDKLCGETWKRNLHGPSRYWWSTTTEWVKNERQWEKGKRDRKELGYEGLPIAFFFSFLSYIHW